MTVHQGPTTDPFLATIYSLTIHKKVASNSKYSHRIVEYNSITWGEKMATATSKRPKSASVKHASLEQTGAFLQALPEKPKEELSLKEAISQLQVPLRAALAKGYSYQELAAMLAQKGINISAFTLKNYVPSGKRSGNKTQSVANTTSRPGRKPAAQKAAAEQSATKSPRSTAAKTSRGTTSTKSDSATTSKASSGKTTTAAKTKASSGATVKQTSAGRTTQKSTGAAKSKPVTNTRTAAKSPTPRRGKKTS
jgi:hypothetical protein